MFNQLQAIGHLSHDGQIRYLPSGQAVYKNGIATSHKWKDQSGQNKEEIMFMDIVIFGKAGEIANQYLRKGSKVFLVGRVVLEKWTAQDGTNRSKHTLRVETMKMLGSKSTEQQYPPHEYQTIREGSAPAENNVFHSEPTSMDYNTPEIDIDEDEIPFNKG